MVSYRFQRRLCFTTLLKTCCCCFCFVRVVVCIFYVPNLFHRGCQGDSCRYSNRTCCSCSGSETCDLWTWKGLPLYCSLSLMWTQPCCVFVDHTATGATVHTLSRNRSRTRKTLLFGFRENCFRYIVTTCITNLTGCKPSAKFWVEMLLNCFLLVYLFISCHQQDGRALISCALCKITCKFTWMFTVRSMQKYRGWNGFRKVFNRWIVFGSD